MKRWRGKKRIVNEYNTGERSQVTRYGKKWKGEKETRKNSFTVCKLYREKKGKRKRSTYTDTH